MTHALHSTDKEPLPPVSGLRLRARLNRNTTAAKFIPCSFP